MKKFFVDGKEVTANELDHELMCETIVYGMAGKRIIKNEIHLVRHSEMYVDLREETKRTKAALEDLNLKPRFK